ncbi:MAG TPA: type II/IV secretion system ATPase subunit [Candidatus Thermoplasmatota archaeon]|nr:type II/IV secretion system ATPase subunit [Candidatus Thermoplasmatota archaeon]
MPSNPSTRKKAAPAQPKKATKAAKPARPAKAGGRKAAAGPRKRAPLQETVVFAARKEAPAPANPPRLASATPSATTSIPAQPAPSPPAAPKATMAAAPAPPAPKPSAPRRAPAHDPLMSALQGRTTVKVKQPPAPPAVASSGSGKRKGAAIPASVLADPEARAPVAEQDGVTQIPPVPAGTRVVESTMLVPDRAWVRILLDETTATHLYQVVEPVLSVDEKAIFDFLRDTLIRTLEGRSSAGREGKDWAGVLLEAARQAIRDHRVRIDAVGQERVEYHLLRDFLGYGPIDVMMRDPMIEDISCDGPGIPLYLFHRRYDSMRTTVVFDDEIELDRFVIRLAQRSGKHISVADPLLDATLPDGSRLQTTLSREITTRGSSFTIRKFRADPLTPPDLIRYGTLNAEMASFMWFVMEMGASFLLAGGTASGKTTTLNAICQFIPPEKKIVSIEDTREINLAHENWIAGITRAGFGREGLGVKSTGAVDMYKLLESALRQRPEYLLVGEVRGAEALTLFQAMATGHAVYSTMHADSVPSAIYRLENEPINVPRMMLQTLDLVLIQGQARVKGKLVRRIKELSELVGFDPDTKEILSNTVFSWDPTEDKHVYLGKSYILEQVMQARNMTEEQLLKEWRQRIEVLEWMVSSGVRRYDEVAGAIGAYYRDPERFLARIRGKAA